MLVNRRTDLKSLKFGKDRIGGGSSNQPYVKSSIPNSFSDIGTTGGPDFLLRGGSLTPNRIANDTSRLTKMFFDFKSPNGLLFTAKQNTLSRTSVAVNGSGKVLNNGIYLPTSTILGAAGNPIGLHLNKQGIDPFKGLSKEGGGVFSLFGIEDPLGQPYYKDIVKKNSKSRLETYLSTHITNKSEGNLYEYGGGPGSILGIGTTKIPLLNPNERTGVNNPTLNYNQNFLTLGSSNQEFLIGDNITTITYNPSKYLNLKPKYSLETQNRVNNITYKLGATSKYFSVLNDSSQDKILGSDINIPLLNSVYKPNTLDNWGGVDTSNTLTQQQLVDFTSSKLDPNKIREDFRKDTSKTLSLNYSKNNIEQRVNLGNPGKKGNISNYQIGKRDNSGKNLGALDKITSLPLYKSTNIDTEKPINDLVKFRIAVIDNDNPTLKTYIHFRAFIDSMSDTYSSDWQSQNFMGRGEKFYQYRGFDRSVALSWTVVAQSKAELIPMYQKLNYLASVCAPDYSNKGYMRGNLIELTVGGYLFNQPGIMNGITFDIPTESPWEIAIPSTESSSDPNNTSSLISDSSVKELPHMIKVTGFNFTPIHNFVPSIQKNKYNGEGDSVSEYGIQRYIALDNGFNGTNYKINNG